MGDFFVVFVSPSEKDYMFPTEMYRQTKYRASSPATEDVNSILSKETRHLYQKKIFLSRERHGCSNMLETVLKVIYKDKLNKTFSENVQTELFL